METSVLRTAQGMLFAQDKLLLCIEGKNNSRTNINMQEVIFMVAPRPARAWDVGKQPPFKVLALPPPPEIEAEYSKNGEN
ncbi:hypothetical protein CDL15_Pgr024135 [Punica granatum]|uniref:Uncharacterized protein n=1 Tax=Punica granatum TaxID=22663 RepID=A0A218XWE1_PUNGR|nr:hypothetical protein CDL15_Pgr024135 [Punica granatum]